jgi:hypothetical protein
VSEEPDRAATLSDLKALEKRLERRLESRLEKRLGAIIQASHEETRRHFNIMVEKVEAAVKLVAEVNAHHAVVLDDHEARPKEIEKTPSA